MQARIQQARREAETLKDKIKRKKDELADTTRTSLPASRLTVPCCESYARHDRRSL
jgi:guanine nucleotide-binding protein G(I)/G(S)/G(T) subunit beta-1